MKVLKMSSRLALILLSLSMVLSACAQPQKPKEVVTLRVALLPILDGLPIQVANQEGYFSENNLNVEIINIASAPERDQVIASGQADGMINEVVSSILQNQEQVRVQVVRYARTASSDTALFRILAAADSGIATAQDLKGVEIGISQGTVIEYLTDRLLQAEGFSAEDIKGIAVPKIPDRLALLNSGELKAAMLPEPLSSLAAQGGAKVVLDDTTHPEYSYSVITFRKEVIDQHPEAIRAFLAAVEKAVQQINSDPAKYSSLLSDLQLVPPPLLGSFEVPEFPKAGVPTQEQYADVLAWVKEKGLLSVDVPYANTITDAYLP